MKIEIIVNNVGDGDAILLALQKQEASCVMIVDAGRIGDEAPVYKETMILLEKYGKPAPDLFIGTHYDNDHIAGLLPLLKRFYKNPSQLWMFDTSNLKKAVAEIAPATRTFGMFPTEQDVVIGGRSNPREEMLTEQLITSLKKEQEILDYASANGWKVTEPVAGECFLEGWPELKILGPTKEYYKSLFPEKFSAETLIKEIILESDASKLLASDKDPCASFDKKTSPVSPVNLNSLVFSIAADGNKYLFTGDAGIDSFYNIPDYRDELKNVFWLKQPHHGSANNFNKDLLDLMMPKKIAISGDKYISNELLNCLRFKCKDVQTTRDLKTIRWTF